MDYSKLGLKCGLEIHQQLDGKKLFCNCSAIIKDTEPDLKIMRRLRAVVGETGEIDAAAIHEQERHKYFIYNAYNDCTCLVELDEEPPRPINEDSVRTAYVVSKLLKARIVDEIQVMRKTVVDGSNTTGFQRTCLVAMDGLITTSFGNIKIDTVCLEEDAAKIAERNHDLDVYNLSRLGIPLLEIATAPVINSPDMVREAAETIGLILRSTGKAKRGLGTIRQDVNISIEGGDRIEIKGAQDLRVLQKIVEYEALRQKSLLDIKKEIRKHDLKPEFFDLAKTLERCESKVVKAAISKNGTILGVKLAGFAGFIGREVQPQRRLGTEFSDYAKVKAGVGGIFHSDELPKYGITQEDVKNIREKLGCKKEDAFVIVADSEERCQKALDAVVGRAKKIFEGIPKEVRRANPDGTSSYMRPMPGGARMYPETDVMPLKMKFDVKMPELISQKTERYQKEMKLSKDLATEIAKSEYNPLFEDVLKKCSIKPGFAAETLVSFRAELVRNYKDTNPDLITEEILEQILCAAGEEKISKESVLAAIVDAAKTGHLDLAKYAAVSDKELEKGIKKIIEKNKGAPVPAIMGEVMKEYRGKASGKAVSEIVKRLLDS